jgi:hypothetical protein
MAFKDQTGETIENSQLQGLSAMQKKVMMRGDSAESGMREAVYGRQRPAKRQ